MRTRNMRRWLPGILVLTLMLLCAVNTPVHAGNPKEAAVAGKKAKKAQPLQAKEPSKEVPEEGLADFTPRSGHFVQKVKRGWSGLLVCSKTIDGVDWQIVESQGLGANGVLAPDGKDAHEYFPSQDPVLYVVSFDEFSRVTTARKGTAIVRYLGRTDSGNLHCELRIEVEADTSELDAALKEAIPSSQIKVIEVRSAAILQGTVPGEEDLELAATVARQFYPQIIHQLKVAAVPPDQKTPKGNASNDSTQPTPAKSKPETPRQTRPVAPEELKALRDDVQALRQDIRQLNELLTKRLESKDRVADPSPKVETSDASQTLRDGLLCFDAGWCVPGQQMRPIVKQLKREGHPIQIVDVDANPDLCKQHGVKSIPCFILLKHGKEVEHTSGITAEKKLRTLLKRLDDADDSGTRSLQSSIDDANAERIEFERLQRALSKNVDLAFEDRPLTEVMKEIGNLIGANIALDPAGLEEEGVAQTTKQTFVMTQISAKMALRHILRPMHLDFVEDNEVILVTSRRRAKELRMPDPEIRRDNSNSKQEVTQASKSRSGAADLIVINYPVADLVMPTTGETKPKPNDWFRLIEMIMTEIEPTCWVSNGGTCTIKTNKSTNSLLVRAPQAIQERVLTLFERERRKMDLQVSFEVRLISTADKPLAELIGTKLKSDPDTGYILLDPAKTNLSIQALQADGGTIVFAPKVTVFNGQTAYVGSKSWLMLDETPIDFSLQMRGFIAPDRRSVGVNLAPNIDFNADTIVDELTRRTINVADGSSLLVDLTEELRAKNPEKVISGRAYLLLQPKIIVQEEEEHRLGEYPFNMPSPTNSQPRESEANQ